MVTRKKSQSVASKSDKTGHAAGPRRRLNELSHAHGLQRSAATMPDARARLTFIDKTMHEASEKTISAVEVSLPLTSRVSIVCADLSLRLSDSELAQQPLLQEVLSTLGEIASAQEELHHNLLQIMEAQEFRDLAGQVVKKILDAAQEIETILLDILPEHAAPEGRHSLIKTEGLTAGPAIKTSADGFSGQDDVDDLMASMGF
ncbi:MAG: hypothetical protein D4R48_01100 [Nitrosomonadales bacterium]|jgi:chemotaxis protein CheZ|nr:MAG: hypothetical protein D4R48_01100 [Nitrosomonadales bacterium]